VEKSEQAIADQLTEINRRAREMSGQVEAVGKSVGVEMASLRRRSGQHSKVLWLLAGSLILNAALTVALVVIGIEVSNTASKVEDVQEVASSEALCPLLGAALRETDDPPPRTPGESDEAFVKRVQAREAANLIVLHGFNALECQTR
jgi:hypothetical protein